MACLSLTVQPSGEPTYSHASIKAHTKHKDAYFFFFKYSVTQTIEFEKQLCHTIAVEYHKYDANEY